MNIGYQDKITYDNIWYFLCVLGPYLNPEELTALNQLFQLMKEDYTPVQEFGDESFKYSFLKRANTYMAQEPTIFKLPNNIDESVKGMLQNFNEAQEHITVDELIFLYHLLYMINEYGMTVGLTKENEQYQLELSYNRRVKEMA